MGYSYQEGEGWDTVIKRGGLGYSYQEGRVRMQLSRGEGWDTVIKRGGLGYSYQKGRAGIQLSKGEGWDPINRFNPATCSKPGPGFPMLSAVVFFCVR